MIDLTVKNLDNELINKLGVIAAENGQDLEAFVQSALNQIVSNHAAKQNPGLGSRMAARVQTIGLKSHELLPTMSNQVVRDPFTEDK